jgi:hypothetical protein
MYVCGVLIGSDDRTVSQNVTPCVLISVEIIRGGKRRVSESFSLSDVMAVHHSRMVWE